VAAEIHSRLFEPFFTTRAAEGGTGLGLAVVKAIVTDHGGSVSFSSRPGGGASFWVELPVPGAVRAATTA
jgi:signal transduction histidine kinase